MKDLDDRDCRLLKKKCGAPLSAGPDLEQSVKSA